jgi:hypothetical protein
MNLRFPGSLLFADSGWDDPQPGDLGRAVGVSDVTDVFSFWLGVAILASIVVLALLVFVALRLNRPANRSPTESPA